MFFVHLGRQAIYEAFVDGQPLDRRRLPAKGFQHLLGPVKGEAGAGGNVFRCAFSQGQLLQLLQYLDIDLLLETSKVICEVPADMPRSCPGWDRKRNLDDAQPRRVQLYDRVRLHHIEANFPCEGVLTRIGFAATIRQEFGKQSAGRNEPIESFERRRQVAEQFKRGPAPSNAQITCTCPFGASVLSSFLMFNNS